MFDNFILKTDSYKHAHHKMYPDNTTSVYSYFESRGGKMNEVVCFGLHYILKKHFEGIQVTRQAVAQAKKIIDAHMGPGVFNEKGWLYITDELNGYLPLRIKALPEGTVAPNHVPLITVENTDPNCAFLTNFSETVLVQAWYPYTVASNSREMVKIIKSALEESADNLDGLPFKLHDFGYRGSTTVESSGIGGAAHLVNSSGTDTLSALIVAAEFYNADMAGFSIPATEHSIMCSWGRENEYEGIRNIIENHPTGLLAIVSDTYNIYNACKHYATDLKSLILSRDGTLVIRPDSGHPPDVVSQCLEILYEGFKEHVTMVGHGKMYKLLPPQIRLIQGDGIDSDMLKQILDRMLLEGWSADNIAFGSGGGLLQKLDRDTLKFAFKASSFVVDGVRRDVRKDPVTDPGKRSKVGRFKVLKTSDGTFVTAKEEDPGKDQLVMVFENGRLFVNPTFDEIRDRAKL